MCVCAVLAQRGVLRERPFINYLKYLLYWKEPEYAKFLKYVGGGACSFIATNTHARTRSAELQVGSRSSARKERDTAALQGNVTAYTHDERVFVSSGITC